jgi:biopolymer transport protein ExbD
MRKKRSFSDSFSAFDETLINLTPLIDVVFVVLVAFILIAPLLEMDAIDLATGGETSQRDFSGRGSICIYVKADDSIWFHSRAVSSKELLELLKKAYRETPKQIPQIFHDRKACFGTYQFIKNSVEEAGFERMDVFLKSNQ